jgi:predicted dehydrogenase
MGVTLMVGHTFEYNPAVHKLREIVRSGELGDVSYIDAARLNLGIYQPDINVVWDLAPHDISIVNFILGTQPTGVSSWGRANARAGHEDVAYLHLEYEEPEIAAYIRVSWLDPCKVRRVTVVGRDKMVVYNDLAPVERIRIYDSSVRASPCDGEQEMPMTYHYGDIVTPYVAFEEPLALQDRHFVNCIRSGETPRTDGHTGLAVVRVLEAASTALAERTRVSIADGQLAVP